MPTTRGQRPQTRNLAETATGATGPHKLGKNCNYNTSGKLHTEMEHHKLGKMLLGRCLGAAW
eukprot:6476554-Lingulodinium_polyedra.AAC.1